MKICLFLKLASFKATTLHVISRLLLMTYNFVNKMQKKRKILPYFFLDGVSTYIVRARRARAPRGLIVQLMKLRKSMRRILVDFLLWLPLLPRENCRHAAAAGREDVHKKDYLLLCSRACCALGILCVSTSIDHSMQNSGFLFFLFSLFSFQTFFLKNV